MPRAKFYNVPDSQPAAETQPRASIAGREVTFRLAWNQAEAMSEVAELFGQPNRVVSQWAATLRKRGYQLKKFKTGRPGHTATSGGGFKKPPVFVEEAHTFDELNDKLRLGLQLSDQEEARMNQHVQQRAAAVPELRDAGSPVITSGGQR